MQSKNFTELIDEFIEDMRLEKRAKGTLSEYRQRLETVAKIFEDQNLTPETVKNEDISNLRRTLFKENLKTSTVRGKMSAFRVFNIWGVKRGFLPKVIISPDDYPKTTTTDRIRRLSDDDLIVFKNFINERQPNVRAAFWLMIGTGCRVGEAAHLRPSDVSLRGKSVSIDIKDAKWGSDRCIPIVDAEAAKIVWHYREGVTIDNRPLFRVSKRTLQGYATDFAQKTGITFRCHLLRHTFAALLTEKGVPMTTTQFLLGHKSLGMTAHYAQSAITDLSDVKAEI